MFNFGKKKKSFSSQSGRYCSIPARRGDFAYSRLAKNRSVSFKFFLVKILFISIFFGLGYLVFFSSFFAVEKIVVTGNEISKADEIQQIARDIAGKKVFKFFNNSLILIRTGDIEKAILEKFNNINSVSVAKKFPKTIAVSVKEKPADILWCNSIKVEKVSSLPKSADKELVAAAGENLSQEASQCYFSDEGNVIYSKVQSDEPAGGVKVFKDDLINIGDKISDDTVKNFIRSLAKNFNFKTGLEFSYLYLPPISSRELHLVTKGGWKIFFDLNRPVDDQLDVLVEVWREMIPENYKNNMEYIDLRVQERVPWKPKNEPIK